MMKTRNVSVVLGWYDPRVFLGIGRYARQGGWHLVLRTIFDGVLPRDWRGDGLLVSAGDREDLLSFCRHQARKYPTVRIGANTGGIDAPSVEEDDVAAGQLAAEHFLSHGYRHFAWYTTRRGEVADRRLDGYRGVIEQAGHTVTVLDWPASSGRRKDTWANCRNWLARHLAALPKPLALFALDDQLAADAIEVCGEIPLNVPDDVAVMGVGNIESACEYSRVPISSVAFDADRTGYEAAAMLDRLMAGQAAPKQPIVLPPEGIVERESTDAYAAEHPALARAIEFIARNCHRPINVADVVEAAGISRRMLNYLFAHQLRRSPGRHLLHLRIERAKEMLRETDQRAGRIAEVCGFQPVRNFNRCFRRETGTAPLAYRKAHRGGK